MENIPETEALAKLDAHTAQVKREIAEMPSTIAYEKAKAEARKADARLRDELAKVREEMGPEPSLEEGDELLAEFLDPSEGCDEFLVTVKSVIPTGDPREVIIMARARFTDTFWANAKRER